MAHQYHFTTWLERGLELTQGTAYVVPDLDGVCLGTDDDADGRRNN